MKPDFPPIYENLFLLLVAFLFSFLVNRVVKFFPERKVKIGLVLIFWLAFLSFYSNSSILHDFSFLPPPLLLVIGPPLLFVLWIAFTKNQPVPLTVIPIYAPLLFQSFRILMEIILWGLYRNGNLPVQMTFEGLNFDILVGITAIPAGIMAMNHRLSKNSIIIWNIFGILLLCNIVIIAILSTPTPLRVFMNDPANTIVFWFPFILLPGFVVPFAFLMHIISIRQNLRNGKA